MSVSLMYYRLIDRGVIEFAVRDWGIFTLSYMEVPVPKNLDSYVPYKAMIHFKTKDDEWNDDNDERDLLSVKELYSPEMFMQWYKPALIKYLEYKIKQYRTNSAWKDALKDPERIIFFK